MLQLLLLSLTRTEEELVPVDVTVRTELVGLMARILVTVFQTEVRRTDERAVYTVPRSSRNTWLVRRSSIYGNPVKSRFGKILKASGFSMSWGSAYAAWAGKRSRSLIAILVPAQRWVRLLGKDSSAFSVR